jgi:TonB family protein
METLATQESAPLNTEPELHLLIEHDRDQDWRRWRSSGAASVIAHIVLILALLMWPAGVVIGLVCFMWILAWVIDRDRSYDWHYWRTPAIISAFTHVILIAGLLFLPPTAVIGLVFLGWIVAWLRERDRTYDWGRWRTPGAISAVAHVVLIAALLLMPESMTTLRVYESKARPVVTPLYFPTELTQKDPNKGKISKELSVAAATPQPLLRPPSPPPSPKKVPAAAPPPQIAKPEPKLAIVEPPRIELPAAPQPEQIAKLTSPVPPPPPPAQPPKLQLENAITPPPATAPQGNPQARIAMPNNSIDASIRDITKGTLPMTQSVEDVGEVNTNGFGVTVPPSAGRQQSSMELASDPMGADFRPYMRQILQTIKRNWLAVYPEAARQGTRGEVVLLFRIVKDGTVAKVSFSTESGAKALDQAAVAAISASNPLLPLPKEFKGNQIVLRMTFKYNMQR